MFDNKREYYKRLIEVYRKNADSYVKFWHENPTVNEYADFKNPAKGYYMTFYDKTLYAGPFDNNGVPLLDYKGKIGRRYNPTAIAQYGLGFYNRYMYEKKDEYIKRFLVQCDWLVSNLKGNKYNIFVWIYDFDWNKLRAPWYSALSQGCGISALVRAYIITNKDQYLLSARKAYESFIKSIDEGGVVYIDKEGDIWFEEEIDTPPTHILNGFIWALWGIYDLYLLTNDLSIIKLFNMAVSTIEKNLYKYDTGYWSLYGLYQTKLKMIASPFYHSLHITQLKIMYKMTGKEIFQEFAARWEKYSKNLLCRSRALIEKAIFKLIYF